VYVDIRRDSLERRRQTTVGSCVNARVAVASILAQLKFVRCMLNKSAGSLDVGVGRKTAIESNLTIATMKCIADALFLSGS